MKTILNFSIFVLTIFAVLGAASLAKATPTPAQQAQIDELKKSYPMTTCPVSGDSLAHNTMGTKPIDYLYTQKNADGTETTRLVRFCCKDCITKFKKNPDKYLKMIDDAQAKNAASGTSTAPTTN